MIYYQQSLAKLAESMTELEKEKIKSESKKFIEKDHYFGSIFKNLLLEDQVWILSYMSEGKGVIPFEMLTSADSLDIAPTGDFFTINNLYSSLKNSVISKEEHASVEKLYKPLKMRNIDDLNNLYNFQNTIVLCEIFESRAQFLNNKFKFKLRKCNCVRSFSGCVQRDKSKCIITLPTRTDHVELFENMLIGGFSCVYTRLAFHSQILLPCDKKNVKVIYDLMIDGKKNKKSP